MMKIPFSPPDISEEEIAEVVDTLRSGWITTGPKTKRFELDDLVYRYYEAPWNEVVCVIDICDVKRPYANYDKFG